MENNFQGEHKFYKTYELPVSRDHRHFRHKRAWGGAQGQSCIEPQVSLPAHHTHIHRNEEKNEKCHFKEVPYHLKKRKKKERDADVYVIILLSETKGQAISRLSWF